MTPNRSRHLFTGCLTLALLCGLGAGCGKKDENNNTNNTTSNNTTANNTTANNTTANNTTANNTTANNTTANNTTMTTSTNNTTGPTPYEFGCDDLVPTPAGMLADNFGTYDISDGCLGSNPFAGFEALCGDLVWTDARSSNWGGKIFLLDDGNYTTYVTLDVEFDAFFPETCVTPLGQGTCAGMAAFIDTTAGITTTTCTDGDVAGDCNCTITASSGFRGAGTVTQTADGEYTLSGLVLQDDGTYEVSSADYEFAVSNMSVTTQRNDTTDGFTADKAADGSDCEIYCSAFMATCNDNPAVTAYTDDTDCLTQCAGFAPGTAGDMMGDSVACRRYHVFAASDPADVTNPDTHCVHAQAVPTAACVN